MPSLADSLVSSSARRLTMRVRPDLSAQQQRYQGRIYWIVKDPVGLNYFRFQEQEYAILRMLDGESSLDEIRERFEDEFPPEKIGLEELQQFIGTLHRSGLIIADVPGQGHQLKKRRDERKKKELIGAFSNILAIRFKGVDPERFLNWLEPRTRWIYTRTCMAFCLALMASAVMLVLVQFDTFQSKLPAFHQFFNFRNVLWLSVVLAVTKVIHEFGHGLTCKHFGGECHELGVMVLVLTPCLYCNVSDSWMLPNKWHRVYIGAGGMFVEAVMAAICTWIWWFSAPGLLNHLCLSTMFVCSVSTFIFNGNPLLRYDGYYILSDILEIPNLRQKATAILTRKLGWWCLGLEPPDDPFLPQRNQLVFAAYSVAAAAYRWFVAFSILWFLYQFFKPYRLEVIGQMFVLASLYGLVVQPAWKLGQYLRVPGRIDKVKRPRLFATIAILSVVVLAVAFVPLPHRVVCSFELKPRGAAPAYVEVPGILKSVHVKPGDVVKRGDLLATLVNTDLEVEVVTLEGQVNEQRARLENVRESSSRDPQAGVLIGQHEEHLASLERQLKEKQDDLAKLKIKAPAAGTVLPPAEVKASPESDAQLPTWSGTPFDRKNLGAFLQQSVPFCHIGDPTKYDAELVVDQSDREFVDVQQRVDIQLYQLPGSIRRSEISDIPWREFQASPRQLSNKAGGELATKTDESGVERLMSTAYPAKVPLDDPDGLLRIGLTGQGKIHAGTLSLGQRLWRFIAGTFHFKM